VFATTRGVSVSIPKVNFSNVFSTSPLPPRPCRKYADVTDKEFFLLIHANTQIISKQVWHLANCSKSIGTAYFRIFVTYLYVNMLELFTFCITVHAEIVQLIGS
jgi:hypothetical protein